MEYKAFKDLTKEERSEIVEALASGLEVECFYFGKWEPAYSIIDLRYAYRVKQRKLDIPWEIIKPEYKWAAMDSDGNIALFLARPTSHRTFGIWESLCESSDLMALNIDTAGISWENSLTQRPE